MVEDDTIRSLPETLGRHCPTCGARVADGATACSICGAALGSETGEGEVGEGPQRPQGEAVGRSRVRQILRVAVLALIAVVVLVGAAALGLRMSRGEISTELPTFTPTVTFQPTATSTATVTPSITPTSPPTETPTPVPPIEYTVVAGDTLLAIAMEYDVTVDELIAYNGMDSDAIGEGQTLLIPAATPTPGPTPTPDPGQPTETPSPFILHTVRAGDTLSTIAEQYGVSIDAVRAENELPTSSQHIMVGLVLVIPRNTPTPTPAPEFDATPTATPVMRYPAPSMLSPRDTATFVGADAVVALQWSSVGILEEREFYQVELIVPTGEQNVTEQVVLKSTVWRVPGELFPPETVENRAFSWRVSVVRQVTGADDATYKVISQSGRRRTFSWVTE
ncbi:MAG: LysM peptidoglycan-binding domain-containing protein [Anaerolineae bacterium]|nr:LysM peptidoglycan-binding domain-containing protein [Anaerolineae bacterium]